MAEVMTSEGLVVGLILDEKPEAKKAEPVEAEPKKTTKKK